MLCASIEQCLMFELLLNWIKLRVIGAWMSPLNALAHCIHMAYCKCSLISALPVEEFTQQVFFSPPFFFCALRRLIAGSTFALACSQVHLSPFLWPSACVLLIQSWEQQQQLVHEWHEWNIFHYPLILILLLICQRLCIGISQDTSMSRLFENVIVSLSHDWRIICPVDYD